MTHPTKALHKFMMQDYVRMGYDSSSPLSGVLAHILLQFFYFGCTILTFGYDDVSRVYHTNICASTYHCLPWHLFHAIPCWTRPWSLHVPHRFLWAKNSVYR